MLVSGRKSDCVCIRSLVAKAPLIGAKLCAVPLANTPFAPRPTRSTAPNAKSRIANRPMEVPSVAGNGVTALGLRDGPHVRCPFDNFPNAAMGATNWCGECGTIFRRNSIGQIVFSKKFKPKVSEAAGLTLWRSQLGHKQGRGA